MLVPVVECAQDVSFEAHVDIPKFERSAAIDSGYEVLADIGGPGVDLAEAVGVHRPALVEYLLHGLR